MNEWIIFSNWKFWGIFTTDAKITNSAEIVNQQINVNPAWPNFHLSREFPF